MGECALDSSATATGFYKHSNELVGWIKFGQFLDSLRNYQLLKKKCAACIKLYMSDIFVLVYFN